jgi:hypothetical protein
MVRRVQLPPTRSYLPPVSADHVPIESQSSPRPGKQRRNIHAPANRAMLIAPERMGESRSHQVRQAEIWFHLDSSASSRCL